MARRKAKMPPRNKKNFRPTKAGAGMTKAGVAAYEERTPALSLKLPLQARLSPEAKRQSVESLSALVLLGR